MIKKKHEFCTRFIITNNENFNKSPYIVNCNSKSIHKPFIYTTFLRVNVNPYLLKFTNKIPYPCIIQAKCDIQSFFFLILHRPHFWWMCEDTNVARIGSP